MSSSFLGMTVLIFDTKENILCTKNWPRLYQKWGSHYTKLIGCKKNIDLEAEISHKILYVYVFNPFWPGGHWSLYSLGEGQFDPHFLTAPGGLMGHFSFNFNHYTV